MKIHFAIAGLSMASVAFDTPQSAAQMTAASFVPTTASAYQGCVSKIPNLEEYVLSTGSRCILLKGNFEARKSVDHLAELSGVLLEPSDETPLTLRVDKVLKIGEVCSQVCKLELPGSRGLHGKEKPGTEGGRPGVLPSVPPQSPH